MLRYGHCRKLPFRFAPNQHDEILFAVSGPLVSRAGHHPLPVICSPLPPHFKKIPFTFIIASFSEKGVKKM